MATSSLSLEERALVTAMELLRRQLGDTSIVMAAANTKRTDHDFKQQADDLTAFLARRGVEPPRASRSVAGSQTIQSDPAVEALKGIRQDLAALPANIAAVLRGEPGPGGVPQPGAPPLDTLGFGRDEGFGGSRAPRGMAFGEGLGFGGKGQGPGPAQDLRAAPPAGKKAGPAMPLASNPIIGVLGEVAQKFMSIVGPAAILSQVLSSNLSGFQVLQTAVKVLASTIAPVLLPATVALSAGVLALSDVFIEHGMPIMESWFTFILGYGVPAMEFLIDTIDDAASGVEAFAEAVGEVIAWVERQINSLDPFSDDENPDERRFLGMKWSDRGAGEEGVGRGLADTLRSLRLSMGPKAQISGIGEVGRQAQMAALNQDPLEARMLKVQQEMLDKLDRIAANTGRGRADRAYDPAKTGAGDYTGGSATGAGGGGDYGD